MKNSFKFFISSICLIVLLFGCSDSEEETLNENTPAIAIPLEIYKKVYGIRLDYSKKIKQVQATIADKNTTVVKINSRARSINFFMIIILI